MMEIPKFLRERAIQAIDSLLTVQEAAGLMAAHGVGALLVIEDGALVGLISERDITCKVAAEGRDPSVTLVQQVMTSEVISANEADSLEFAMEMMQRHHIRHLPLMRDGEVLTMLSLADLSELRIKLLNSENRNLSAIVSLHDEP
ncbi:MAG: CBS domain-containing protein [Myxococcales bacterium]|nr:CBS domain-containing protein [Myxococcales bacterium]